MVMVLIAGKERNWMVGGVAIYQNMNTVHYCRYYIDVHVKYNSTFNATVSDIGNMCISRCHFGNSQFIIMVAVYISLNNSLHAIQDFLYGNVFIYSHDASALLKKKKNWEKL